MDGTGGEVVGGDISEIPGGGCTPATLPPINDGAMASEPTSIVQVGVGETLDIEIATTIEEVVTTIESEIALTDKSTGRGGTTVGTSVSNAPGIVTTTTEGVVSTAHLTDVVRIDPEIEAIRDVGCTVVFADVELIPLTDLATVPSGVSSGVDLPITADTTVTAVIGSLADEIRVADVNIGSLLQATASVSTAAIRPLVGEGWRRDAHMVEGIFRIVEEMEPPWITVDVLEATVIQFPSVDRETLRLVIMTVMMTQRRCVVRLTRAGLRRGPRVDREGNAFVELDLDYADCYSYSH